MRYYWRTEKNVTRTFFLIALATYLAIHIMNALSHKTMLPTSLLYWILVCSYVSNMFNMHYLKKETAIVAFTLPASNLEKFISRVFYATFCSILILSVAEVLGCLIAAGFAIGMDWLAGNPYNPAILHHFLSLDDWTLLSRASRDVPPLMVFKVIFYFVLLVLPMLSLFTLCSLLFHRWGIVVATMLILAFVFTQVAFAGLLHGPGVHNYWGPLLWFFAIVIIVCYALAYRSFCRQEMRKKCIHI